MKKKISLLLSILMLVTVMIPANVFAAADTGFEAALKIAKEKFTIPKDFTKFSYNISTESDKKVWHFTWSPKDNMGGSMSVTVDENGTIINYYKYTEYDYSTKKKLPKLSKQDAKSKAEEFIKNIDPNLPAQLRYMENTQYSTADYSSSFYFTRVVKGISFPSNSVNLEVNRNTGEIVSYSRNWTDNLVFPEATKAISLEMAQKAYKEKLGLSLVYRSLVEGESTKTYPAYIPKYSNSYIEALTGEKINLYRDYYGPYYNGMGGAYDKMFSEAVQGKEEVVITPEEQKAIEEVSKLLSKEDIEKKIRAIQVLELTDEFKVTSANLYKDWNDRDDFLWDVYFVKESKDKKGENFSVNVRASAKNGEIKSFWNSRPYKEGETAKFDLAASKAAVESFLKEFNAEKFKDTEYDDSYSENEIPMPTEEKPREFSFRYVRKVNNALFPNNALLVRYDAVNGKVTSYDMTWNNVEFAPLDKIITIDNAYKAIFDSVGLELQYKLDYPNEYYLKFRDEMKKPEVKLVYAFKPQKPQIIDANTGALLSENGTPYKEVKAIEFKDIAGNFAEKHIKVLVEYGIYTEGGEFKPNQAITQKEYLLLLAKLFNYYDYYSSSDKDKQIEQIYRMFIRDGVVKESEKSPDSIVKREDGIKFLIRGMKYDKVADIKGIFKCEYKDVNKMHPDLVGYIAIADGLGIAKGKGGYFNPKGNLTNAQVAVMVYNYLQI
ncbi:MAG: S-layer homology domain-containing protein [Clostridia bacterium]|nr:S-layer homology domain-containing protein [Clostridia bacterium]